MNEALAIQAMQEYRTSLRRGTLNQGVVIGVETHSPLGKKMSCAIVQLNNGLKGLIYEDHFDKHQFRSLVGFIDHKIDFMVLDIRKLGKNPNDVQVFDEEKGIVLLSRTQALDELQEEFWVTAEANHVVTGTVSGFQDERLYMLVKGVTCVLPIQDYEYDWTVTGLNLVPLGQELTVRISHIDRDKKQVRVSRKELLEDPWKFVYDDFPLESFKRGVVTGVVENLGIFVKLKPGIDALAWFPAKLPGHDIIGKTVAVKIHRIDQQGKRIRVKIINFPHMIY